MAWENFGNPYSIFTDTSYQNLPNEIVCSDRYQWGFPILSNLTTSEYVTLSVPYANLSNSWTHDIELGNNSILRIICNRVDGGVVQFKFRYIAPNIDLAPTNIISVRPFWTGSAFGDVWLSFVGIVDNTNQQGLFYVAHSSNDGRGNFVYADKVAPNNSILYQFITNSVIPQYNWQSVPSISGKNGILTLSTLNDVNDGEPVETSDTSKFNLTDDSNVSALVAARLSE